MIWYLIIVYLNKEPIYIPEPTYDYCAGARALVYESLPKKKEMWFIGRVYIYEPETPKVIAYCIQGLKP